MPSGIYNHKKKYEKSKCKICGKELSLRKYKYCRKHWSITFKGNKNPNWKGGLPKCSICGKQLSSYSSKYCRSHKVISKKHRENLKLSHSKKMEEGIWKNQYGGYKGGYQNKLHHNRQRRIKKLNAKGSHTFEEWENLKKKYNYMCLCCKKSEPEITLSEDHIIPLSKSGTDNIENIQPLCRSCNSKKQVEIKNYIPEVVKTTMEIEKF